MKNHLKVVAADGKILDKDIAAQESNAIIFDDFKAKLAPLASVGKHAGEALLWILGGVRYVLFLVLYWLRIVIYPALSFAAGIALIAAIVLLATQHRLDIMWKLAGFSFGCFVVLWFYDTVLLYLSPQQMMLDGRVSNHD